ncbi:DNA N-6-adenine-methyltransferase [Calothrix sp. UHCC 0171]|uniref:DNA N-6-adenine-methyltransferase n=1 Tax=Calothrix sp. UHCC 0171 TaxID=3110245 RepID=UPI002B21970F|nr:DNA N-6-adenine-methyltransferase [Calothrix sp. UHCC 0171]MEA5574692.1 DNA N-6-adenine-methyltransferase [Calothrix sp. UHCC 0171]
MCRDRVFCPTSLSLKAISLWQPWASLIPLGLKHYETRSWKTNYRGKLLICSTTNNPKHYREYLKIREELQLPDWDEDNFPHGQVIALVDLVDCIEMTPEFIAQQSRTEILCGDWQVGRYAWKLENIQPITEPFVVKGKQGLFSISVENLEFDVGGESTKGKEESLKLLTVDDKPPTHNSQLQTPNSKPKDQSPNKNDCWYTPPHIIDLIVQVLGQIDLDPCADDGKHIPAAQHFTATDDGLNRDWHGHVYINPPYSCPGVWMAKLQAEVESGQVKEVIALVPAATDTNWLSPVLKLQPVCFWKGRIKFLDVNYQPKLPARQSHVLVYWGENWERFREVFDPHGFVTVPKQFLGDKLNNEISPRKTSESLQHEDRTDIQISPTLGDTSQFLGDKLDSDISPRKIRRTKGDGSGSIHYRTVTKKGKDYHEAYYHYEFWNGGDRLVKSSRYIPKRLLTQVQKMDVEKVPVREILQVLGVIFE